MRSSSSDQWLYVAAPLLVYGTVVLGLAAWGWGRGGGGRNPAKTFFLSIGFTLRRVTGVAGWAMAGALTGLTAAGIAAIGLYWDVAWHIDYGRDKQLFTPPHTMILIGLNGLLFAGGVAVLFATLEGDGDTRRSWGRVRVPWSAVVLGALGLGASAAFPLDNLWHEAYGVDVTLWSPTHLQLIAGGSLSPLAVWLMTREGRRQAASEPTVLGRAIVVVTFGAVLTGLSIVQGEFDFGVPQFQVLYQPLLISAAAGMALVGARLALGRGGALGAAMVFLALRGGFALLVGAALNHSVPRFPLYAVAAGAVEAVALLLGTRRRLRFAVVSGVAVGTVGLAAELAWIRLSGWGSPAAHGLPVAVILSVVAAVAAGVIGVAFVQGAAPAAAPPGPSGPSEREALGPSGPSEREALGPSGPSEREALGPSGPSEREALRPLLVAGAGLALVVVLAIPLPRNVGAVSAVISLDRLQGQAKVAVQLEPPSAARSASQFGVISWQGGGRVLADLDQVGPGRYVSSRSVPVSGRWKTMVSLQRGDEVMAAPVYLPADPEIGASAVLAQAERQVAFSPNTDILLREAKDGPAWPALASYAGVALVVTLWLWLLTRTASQAPPPCRGVGGSVGIGPRAASASASALK